jgi:hypothetical protein
MKITNYACDYCGKEVVKKHLLNPMTKKKKTSIEEFADTFRDNPKEIIAWAKREIKEYQKLIKILEGNIYQKL